jgi:hypothetical protein
MVCSKDGTSSNHCTGSEDGSETCLSVHGAELLPIETLFGPFLNILCALLTNRHFERFLSLDELVDIVQGTGHLLTEQVAIITGGARSNHNEINLLYYILRQITNTAV